MLNMSDQFYNYLTSKLFDYFKDNNLVAGDKFYIQFDEDSQIINFCRVNQFQKAILCKLHNK